MKFLEEPKRFQPIGERKGTSWPITARSPTDDRLFTANAPFYKHFHRSLQNICIFSGSAIFHSLGAQWKCRRINFANSVQWKLIFIVLQSARGGSTPVKF
jgi:hypothetical protein